MMQFGTIGAFGFQDFHPPEVIGLYAGAGCTVVQAYRNRARPIPATEMVAVCRDLRLTIDSLHAHFGDDLDPSSDDESVRRSTLDAYAGEADFCRELGAGLAVIHPSPSGAASGDPRRRRDQFRRSLEDFARLGERTGVVFAFENMPAYHPVGADVQELLDDVCSVGSPHVVFMLDFGHAHMTCGIGQALRIADGHLAYTHVHDNDGVHDAHILPYRGTLPWDECRRELHKIGYDGVFLLEVFEKAEDLRRLLNDEWKRNMQAILNNGR